MFITDSIKEAKRKYANADFNLLTSQGSVGFYKACEVTQIFIFDNKAQKVINFYTLFVFDEINSLDKNPTHLGKPLDLNNRYMCGIQKKRISLEKAAECFEKIQKGSLDYDEACQVINDFYLLPKAFIPQNMKDEVFLNHILKPNYWGDSYVIEFFDEKKTLLSEILSDGAVTKKIYDYLENNSKVKFNFSKVYDRIGNILFQFPVTLYKANIFLDENGSDIHLNLRNHPQLVTGRNLHITLSSNFDNGVTGFDCLDTDNLEVDHIFCLGDDNNLTTTIEDIDKKILLYKSEVNFVRDIQFSMNLGEQYSKARIINSETGYTEIEMVHRDVFNVFDKKEHTYFERITQRIINSEIIEQSKKLGVFKYNQRNEALQFIRQLVTNVSADFNALYLWDPYLMPDDIVNTLYFENSGMSFCCITDYQKTKSIMGATDFSDYKEKIQNKFKCLSNNHRVNLKLLARHDNYGWEFHDRFLIFVPKDAFVLPEVYSLGISVNQLGKHHHIIQKVPNPRIILENFEELWRELDNDACCVTQFPENKY